MPLVLFASPAKTLSSSCGPASIFRSCFRTLRYFHVPFRHRRDSSLGVSKDRPSTDISRLRPVPVHRSEDLLPFGLKLPSSKRLPFLPFLPAPTVCSACDPTGLLHPAISHGVRDVSSIPCAADSLAGTVAAGAAFPSLAFHTLRRFSLADSRIASPRPFPSRRSSALWLLRSPVLPPVPE